MTILVVAIDFGTTYSGYAYSFKSKPTEIKTNQSWSKSLISLKTPTVILVDQDRKFHAFGYEAEEKYAQLLEDDEADGWALFRRFKMQLYKNPDLSKGLEVTDLSGKVKIPAISAFSMAIRYLKDHVLATLNEKRSGKLIIDESDVHFVLTVPAIWDDRARLFMREAAADAGIPNDRFSLALESEAASVWCQNIPFVVSTDGDHYDLKTVGSKYMVVDMGGGTVDITLHQKLANGKLRELHKANGGNWGGTQVDKAFVNTLRDVLGQETLKRFEEECLNDVFDLLKEFETTKRAIQPDSSGSVKIRLPLSLQMLKLEEKEDLKGCQLRKEFMKTLMSKNYGDMITIKDNRLRIDASIAVGMFQHPVSRICEHMRELLCDPDVGDINTILVVGGFSECEIVQNAIKNEFKRKKVIFPPEPGLAVLKGAVLFGHNPGIIASRKARFTYGVRGSVEFDSAQHPAHTKRIVNGVAMCSDVFKVLVKQGEEVETGHRITETKYPASDDDRTANIELFLSTDPNPVFVTDPTCSKIGHMHVKLPRGNTTKERGYEIAFIFGEIEIMLKVKHLKTEESFTEYFGFM
ncbi:heat shock 70 kDa protein 12A-like isoform X2 [Mercenaria mercenaria]|nr:heat shock 70 kDa protein 12A-like isoform X2 [Mercenaria mercenaria]